MSRVADAVRASNPGRFDSMSDFEIETLVAAADPRYKAAVDAERAEGKPPAPGGLAKPPDPSTLEDRSFGQSVQESMYKASPLPYLPSAETAREALPAVGGTIGGIVGGGTGLAAGGIGVVPGAVGGAAAGQAAGEVIRQGIRRLQGLDADRTLGERALDVAQEGGIGGITEVTGGLANRALVGTGRGLMRYAAGPGKKLLEEFPTVIDDALRYGARLSKRGGVASEATTTASRELADKMILEAEQAGAPGLDLIEDIISPTRARVGPQAQRQAQLGVEHSVPSLEGRLGRIKAEAFNPESMAGPKVITERAGTVASPLDTMPQQRMELGDTQFGLAPTRIFEPSAHEVRTVTELGPYANLAPRRMVTGEATEAATTRVLPPKPYDNIPLTEAQGLKREAQDLADTAFRTQDRGGNINAIDMATDKALATSFKEGIEKQVPGLGAVNDATRRQMGVNFLIEDAVARKGGMPSTIAAATIAGNAVPLLFTGHPVAAATAALTGAGIKAATSPYTIGRAATAAYSQAPYQGLYHKAMTEGLRNLFSGEPD